MAEQILGTRASSHGRFAVPALSAGNRIGSDRLTPAKPARPVTTNAGLFRHLRFSSSAGPTRRVTRIAGNFGVEFAGPTLVSFPDDHAVRGTDGSARSPTNSSSTPVPRQTLYGQPRQQLRGTQTVDLTAGNGGKPDPRDLHGDARQTAS